MLGKLPYDCVNLISEFSGHSGGTEKSNVWKRRFTHDVLPKVDKGYKVVGVWLKNNEPEKCLNCYVYGDQSEIGLCANCEADDISQYDVMAFEEFYNRGYRSKMFPCAESLRRYMKLSNLRGYTWIHYQWSKELLTEVKRRGLSSE